MIVEDDFLNQLRRLFDLNLYEVKIWTALLSRGTSTAGELSEIGDVPRSRAYDILESLEKKGFIIMKLGKPITYIAVPPNEVVERAKKNVHNNANDAVKKLEKVKGTDLMKELDTLHKQGIEFIEPADLSGALRGRTNSYMHMDTILKRAKKDVVLVTSEEGLQRKLDSMKATLQALKRKGVNTRIVAKPGSNSKQLTKAVGSLASLKFSDKLNARFCIVDNKELMFMVMDDNEVHPSYDLGIWVNSPFFASTMSQMFDMAWRTM